MVIAYSNRPSISKRIFIYNGLVLICHIQTFIMQKKTNKIILCLKGRSNEDLPRAPRHHATALLTVFWSGGIVSSLDNRLFHEELYQFVKFVIRWNVKNMWEFWTQHERGRNVRNIFWISKFQIWFYFPKRNVNAVGKLRWAFADKHICELLIYQVINFDEKQRLFVGVTIDRRVFNISLCHLFNSTKVPWSSYPT